MEKYGRFTQATDDKIVRHMRFALWITKATETRSKYAILLAFLCKNDYAEANNITLYYVVCLVGVL